MFIRNLQILSVYIGLGCIYVYIVNVLVSDALRDQHKWTSLNIDSHLHTVYQQARLPVLTLHVAVILFVLV